MFKELFEIIGDFFRQMLHSRLFPLAMAIVILFCVLVGRLFQLQILDGETYQENYVQKTLAEIPQSGVRGNIYDCNGKLLAGNEVVYDIAFRDTGAYKTHQAKNTAALKISNLIDQMDETMVMEIPIQVNETTGKFEFSTQSTSRIRRFLIDLMGKAYIEQKLEKEGIDVYSYTAEELIDFLESKYYFSRWQTEDKQEMLPLLTNKQILQVLNIRYKLTLTAYSKYQSINLAIDVSQETVAATMELSSEVEGLSISEDAKRVYPYGEYAASIIGYTKVADSDELEALQETYPDADYQTGDVIGKGGIEEAMESYLQGKKGSQTVYLDSVGQILDVVATDEAEPGNDVYLNIDIEKQVGIYHLLEQMIAGIIVQNLVNYDVVKEEQKYPPIGVKQVYQNLISNNVLDLNRFSDTDASDVEHQMYEQFAAEYQSTVDALRTQLTAADAAAYSDLPEAMQTYMDYLYSEWLLTDSGLLKSSDIDTSDSVYQQWRNREISLQAFLRQAIVQEWIDVSQIETDNRYSSAEQLYEALVSQMLAALEDNKDFAKLIYDDLITNNRITGNQVCAALLYQEVLPYDEAAVSSLMNGNAQTAYDFIREQIRTLRITPSQLALDPCSGGVVITDVNTGKILSLVNYPSYDNNYFSGSVDAAYYQSLLENKSLPLFNRATQSTIAPGSTFKMLTLIAGLEENVISPTELVNCTVLFEKVTPSPSCWNHDGHGWVYSQTALAGSCNYYFYEVGYRLSETADGTISSAQGVDTLAKYAKMFGFDQKSGVEMTESTPHISDQESIASAIGQGTHAYTTMNLSRYVTAIANQGTLYDLSLVDSVKDSSGKTVEEFQPKVASTIELSENTWSTVTSAMREVVKSGTIEGYFDDCPVEVAGKTGSAQEDLTRAEHAQFVSFAPYDDPEISVSITIPNGYTSGNNAHLADEVYKLWYGTLTNDEIAERDAYDLGNSAVVSD